MIGQATVGFLILRVLILWTPISLGSKNLDRRRRAVEDVVNGALCDHVL